MAFDFGLVRIGVAVGNTELKIPHPIDTVIGKTKSHKFDQVKKLIQKWQPKQIVIGCPTPSDDKQILLHSIKKFANRINVTFKIPIIYINEAFSSDIASAKLGELHRNIFANKQKIDALAACVILQRFFDSME